MTDKELKRYRLAVMVKTVLLRKDGPDASRLSNIMYKEIMISNTDSFASIGSLAEKEMQRIMAKELPSSLLEGKDNKLPDALRPAVCDRIEACLNIFLSSDVMAEKRSRFKMAARKMLDRIGWLYGIEYLPEAAELLRSKLRRQIKVYECTMNLADHYVDIEPLYKAAANITIGERVRRDNDKDIAEFYTALCDNTRNACTRIIARFSRDLLTSICENPEWEKVNASNMKLRENCRRLVEQYEVPEDNLDVFSNPEVTNLEEYI